MRNPKRSFLNSKLGLACLLLIFASGSLQASEASEVWARLYRRSQTHEHRYEIMVNVVEQDDRDLIPFLAETLEELILTQDNPRSATDAVLHHRLMTLVVQELGSLRAREAADKVYLVIRDVADPYLKREALIAMGKMGARDYAKDVAIVLRNVNYFNEYTDAMGDEMVAFGAITCLERLKEPIGYAPVFYASVSWYTNRVLEKALRALPNIMEDPSEILGEIVDTESNFVVKLQALRQEERSAAPPENKIQVATRGLNEGLVRVGQNIMERRDLSELRLGAMEMLIRLEAHNQAAIPLLKKVYKLGYNANEQMAALRALGVNATDQAATTLRQLLAEQNDRQEQGMPPRDNRVVRVMIRALADTGSQIGYEELMRVKFVGYGDGVVREAEAGLRMLEQ